MKLGRKKVKCLLVFALCLFCAFAVQAQDEPIRWTLEAKTLAPLKASDKFEARLGAKLGEGWHFYSITQPAGGPTRTTIKLANNQPFKLAGTVEGPKVEAVFDKNFNMSTEFYIGSAEFKLPLMVATSATTIPATLTVEVTFQLCNDEVCLPPKTLPVQTALAARKAANATAVNATTNDAATTNASAPADGLAAGAQVPDFAFTDFNGKPRKFSEFRGRYVLLDFWATWCKPCLADIPRLKELYAKHKAQGFEIIGMDSETLGQEGEDADPEFAKETHERAKQIISTRGVTWAQATSDTSVPIATRVFGVESLPTKILIDPQGKVVAWVKEGQDLDALLARLLAGNKARQL